LLARRIRSFPEGVFPPSPPPSLLSVLTDELLVTASDVVKSVAAEDKALSGNAGFRLLAWTVADARGATAVLDKPLALTVGRRLDSRALTVREELAQAAEQDQGCSINVSEQAAMAKAREEVYIGFGELESLLPPDPMPNAQCPDPMPNAPDPMPKAAEPNAPRPVLEWRELEARLRDHGLRFPMTFLEELERNDNSIPPDLAELLGREGVQRMWACVSERGEPHLDGDEWWTSGLFQFVRQLMGRVDCLTERRDELEARLKEWHADHAERCEENVKLLGELRAAEAREEALHEVIRRCRWG
jgi:hypothetical protein